MTSMQKMKILAPAKINLFLEVGKKRKDGYHNIISFVEIINLCDTLEFNQADNTEVKFLSRWEIPKSENSVLKAIATLQKASGTNQGVHVTVTKRIPVGSGLGGESTDAAATLAVLNKMWQLNFSVDRLMYIASSIGADVSLFVRGKRCFASGLGENVQPVDCNRKFWYFLAIPDFSVQTKKIYAAYDKFGQYGNLTKANAQAKILYNAILRGNINKMEDVMFNRLKEVTFRKQEDINIIKTRLENEYKKKFFMTGSGGTLYAVFDQEPPAQEIFRTFQIENWEGIVVESLAIA